MDRNRELLAHLSPELIVPVRQPEGPAIGRGADVPGNARHPGARVLAGRETAQSRMVQDPDLRDAGLVASAQRIEHYEIAVYGTLATWAKQLGLDEDLRTLHAILQEEKRADERLTELAERIVNPEAAQA